MTGQKLAHNVRGTGPEKLFLPVKERFACIRAQGLRVGLLL